MSISIREFLVAVRRQESPFYSAIYKAGKSIIGFSFPTSKLIHGALFAERSFRISFWRNFTRTFYYEPLFKSQCVRVGKNFKLNQTGEGCAQIYGDLQIYIGDNVKIHDRCIFAGLKVLDKPKLHIGDNVYISPLTNIFVGKSVSIGDFSMIGSRMIVDNSGHPVGDVMKRIKMPGGGPPQADSIRPINIGKFCLLGNYTFIYPGVTMGDGSYAVLGAHVVRSVPPFCVVAGNPGKIVAKLPIQPQMAEIVGEEKYREYKDAQRAVKI